MYKCPNCGGEIEFIPSSGKIKCEYCGSEFSVDDDLQKNRKNAEEQDDGEGKGTVYTCSQCGASLYTTEDTGVTFCSYCGSQAFLKRRINGKDDIEPDMIIPFKITKEKCLEIYRSKIKNAWFLPKAMKADQAVEKFRGIYMPCWIYSDELQGKGIYKGTELTRQGSFDINTSYEIDMTCNGKWDGFVYDATSSFPDSIMREIAPYDLRDAQPFNDKYMTGFYADIGNVPSDAYEKEVKGKVDADLKAGIGKQPSVRGYHVDGTQISNKTTTTNEKISAKKGYFPVWFLANKNEHTGKMSYAVINGSTGKIHTDLPIDMKKYLLVALVIAVAAFVILQFFTLKPEYLLGAVMVLLGIMMTFSTKMLAEAYIQKHRLDDIGAEYIDDDPVRKKYNEKHSNDNTVSKAVKHSSPVGTVVLAALCFVGLPIVLSGVSEVLGLESFFVYGFIIGFIIFVAVKCISPKNSGSSSGGFEYRRNIRLPFGMTMKALALPLIGVIIGIIILLAAPAKDLYYYGGVIVCCLMLILTILRFVKETNELSLRKPAQLGKRGGDENE